MIPQLIDVIFFLNSSKNECHHSVIRKQTLVFRFGKWRQTENVCQAPFSIFQFRPTTSENNVVHKLYWRSKPDWSIWKATMFVRSDRKNVRTLDLYNSVQHSVVHYCLDRKCSDPNRPSQGVFPSSTIQALASLSGIDGYLYWSNCRTSWHYPLDFYG